MRSLRLLLLSASLTSLVTGCSVTEHPASLQDSFSGDVFAPMFGNNNGLSTPYVEGAKFTITVDPGQNQNTTGWKLSSSDPTVMQIGTQTGTGNDDWSVTATGAGHATLTVLDENGKVIDSEGIDVDVPTEVQLCAQGLLLAGASDDKAAVTSIQLVSGGTATFLVRYFDGSQELAGNNALHPTGSGVATTATVAANVSVRDFLEVSASDAGSGGVSLAVGQSVNQVPVTAVDPSTVKSVALAGQDDSKAKNGDTLYVFGRALDADGNDIYGASFSWDVNGAPLPAKSFLIGGPADVLTYQYTSSQSETVSDALSDLSASITVHGAPSTTSEGSTENVGCSVARGVGREGGAAGLGILGAVAVLASRRRRAGRGNAR